MKKRFLLILLSLSLLPVMLTGKPVLASGDGAYSITCINCIAKNFFYEVVTSANEGDPIDVYVSSDAVPDPGKYFTNYFAMDGEPIPQDYPGNCRFTMPAHDITLTALQQDLTAPVLDLTGTQPVKASNVLLGYCEMLEEADPTIHWMEYTGEDQRYSYLLDLNEDHTADIGCKFLNSAATDAEGTITRLPGADKITKDISVSFSQMKDSTCPFSSVTFKIARAEDIQPEPVKKYTITFKANGGKGKMASQTVEAGKNIKLPANAFTRTDYSFAGWNTKADGKGTAYKNKATLTISQNTTLYAQWKADVIALKLDDVKISKSAKKLALRATLTINGKAAKSKKLTFQFGTTRYSATTNKKGIASATVKSSVLKKLTVGKKVKITVTYNKTSIKKSFKVKK